MGDLQAGAGPPSGGNKDIVIPNSNAKRQRRPSVRLNEIGDQSGDSYLRKNKQWKTPDEKHWKLLHEDQKSHPRPQLQPQHHLIPSLKSTSDLILATKLSKTKPLGNLSNGVSNNDSQGPMQVIHEDSTYNQNVGDGHLQLVQYSNGRSMQAKGRNVSRKVRQAKGRRGGTRGACVGGKLGAARALRVSPEEGEGEDNDNEKGSGEDGFGEPMSNASYDADTHDGFGEFDLDTSDSPGDMKGTSGLHADSLENVGFNHHGLVGDEFREQGKLDETWVAVLNNKEHHALTLDYMDGNGLEMPSDTETRFKQEAHEFLKREQKREGEKESIPVNAKHRPPLQDGGVRAWLNGLGLGRYAQLFEMHEVDTEVLPLLTLDDLKDMGINAVGSRRKMYNAIQKLQKNFTV